MVVVQVIVWRGAGASVPAGVAICRCYDAECCHVVALMTSVAML